MHELDARNDSNYGAIDQPGNFPTLLYRSLVVVLLLLRHSCVDTAIEHADRIFARVDTPSAQAFGSSEDDELKATHSSTRGRLIPELQKSGTASGASQRVFYILDEARLAVLKVDSRPILDRNRDQSIRCLLQEKPRLVD